MLLQQAGQRENHRGRGRRAGCVHYRGADLSEPVDVLFLGGAPYANIMAPGLKAYAEKLKPERVCRVVLFTTSNWSRRTVLALRKLLREKGIAVADEYFCAHMLHIQGRREAAKTFGKQT